MKTGQVKLSKSITNKGGFVGFTRFSVYKNISGKYENARIKWLSDRNISQDKIIEILEGELFVFSAGDLSDEKIVYLESYLGKGDLEVGKIKLNNMIENKGLRYIAVFKVCQNKKTGTCENARIKWLSDRGVLQDNIIDILENHPRVFFDERVIENKIEYLEKYLGKGDLKLGNTMLNKIMREKGSSGVVLFQIRRNKAGNYENRKVNLLEKMGYTQDQVIRLMETHLLELFSTNLTKEQSKAYLEYLIKTGELPECVDALR